MAVSNNSKRAWRNPKRDKFVDSEGSPLEHGDGVHEAHGQAEADLAKNVPPHSVDAEQAVLGGILLTPEVLDEISGTLMAEDFYLPAHRLIYSSCIDLADKRAPVDLLSVRNQLKDHGLLEEAGGAVYLATLAQSVVSSARVDYYANIVRDKSQMRNLISACSGIISRSFEPGLETKELLDQSEQAILNVAERRAEKSYKSSAELTSQVFDELDRRAKNRVALTGINTGYKLLNFITGGFQRTDLIILAARPAMGKTAFVLNVAMRAAIGDNYNAPVPVAIFSLEMGMEQLISRMLCSWGRVDLGNMRRNKLDDGDWANLQVAADALSKAPLFFDDSAALSIMELRARARRMKREQNIGLIIIDYLQLMHGSNRNGSRELEISEISRGLKALAKELDIPVIALSQLNRKVEERDDKRPKLSDLRESGAIEQDADVIMFIHREDAYKKHEERPDAGEAEIIIGKHRNGQVGTVKLVYIPAYTQFEEPQREPQSPATGL